jgi:acyloxyacyl hydrolase
MNIWQWLYNAIEAWTDQHIPPIDFDGDKFVSFTETLRGRDWRGRDCDGLSAEVYPGRQSTSFPDSVDQDCNGISGRDHLGRSYDELYCAGTDRRGLIALGDSATAHFRIPPQYITAADINSTTYEHFLFWGLNEFDWPHRSWGTGHLNDTTGDCSGPVDSVYLNLYRRVSWFSLFY